MKKTTTAIKFLIKGTGLTLGLGMLAYQSGANANPFYQMIQGYIVAQQSPNDIIIDANPQIPPPPTVNTSSVDTRFECRMDGGRYKVMYRPQSQGSQPYPWAIPSDLGDGWTAERRCYEISRRLEMYRPDGLLELRTGQENNYNTICVTTQADPRCRIVLTVPPGKNPEITRDQIFQTLVSAEDGRYTQGVSAFTGGSSVNNPLGQLLNGKIPQISKPVQGRSNGISLRPFLDPADGGTGAKLPKNPTNSNPRPSNSRTFNPNLFR